MKDERQLLQLLCPVERLTVRRPTAGMPLAVLRR